LPALFSSQNDGLVKSRNPIKFVIPAKAGIHLLQRVLDSGFRRGDASWDFLRDHQKYAFSFLPHLSDNQPMKGYSGQDRFGLSLGLAKGK
jgi:hypothetical protein